MSDYVPFQIQFEIIKRLPVKSLFKFRSVSQPWKSLIDSSEFIAEYNVSQTQPQRLSVWYNDPWSAKDRFVSFVDDDTFTLHEFTSTVPKLIKNLQCVVGSSHGLLCLYSYYKDPGRSTNDETVKGVVLWNPSIRKSVYITTHVSSQWCEEQSTVLGFGVSPATNDPTVVKFKRVTYGDPRTKDHMHWVVEVFTLSAGCWRIPSTKPPNGTITLTWEQVVIDKFIYRFCFDGIPSLRNNLIMSYDMTTEEFRMVNLPDCLAHQRCVNLSISKVWESLAVLEYSRNINKQVCVVWMMDRVVANLFTKLFTIKTPNIWDFRPNITLGFTKSGKPILGLKGRDEEPAALVVYEPRSEHIKEIGIYGRYGLFFVGSYVETLLLHEQVNYSVYSYNN